MTLDRLGTANAPRQLFATTPAQRVALARQQFFEEGVRPSGLVGEAVLQSWMRCCRTHSDRQRIVPFDPVTPSRLHATLARNRELLEVARQELATMEHSLAGTDCRVILTDRDGVVVHVTHESAPAHQPVLRKTARVGVNISERVVGTTAPGIVASTGLACTVDGAEHYFDVLREMQCAAAPIRGIDGRLAGVLDLTVEAQRFGFDAASMVALYATTIENRLLQAQSREQLILRFQASPTLLGTPLEGLAGIASDGTIAWLNGAGRGSSATCPSSPMRAASNACWATTSRACCGWAGASRRSRCGWPAGSACGCRRGCKGPMASTSDTRWRWRSASRHRRRHRSRRSRCSRRTRRSSSPPMRRPRRRPARCASTAAS